MDSDFEVGINKAIDAAKGETHEYPSYTHNTLVTEKLDELAEAISEGGGGASALSDLTDVDISGTVQGGKVLKYNAVEEKWTPGDDSGNVQSDWNEDDPTSGAFILNKPTIPAAQVQADWNESDSSDPSYIQNKPTIPETPFVLADCTIHVTKPYDSSMLTITISDADGNTLYTNTFDNGNVWGSFDTVSDTFSYGGIINNISMYGDGEELDISQNWFHITLNSLSYSAGDNSRNPSYAQDITIQSSAKAPVSSIKMDKVNPTGSGTLSLNRAANSLVGSNSTTVGSDNTASGDASFADGHYTVANHAYQHVFGEYNTPDNSIAASTARGTYIEIVGNGSNDNSRSNARTLDWYGNEKLAGDLLLWDGLISVTTALGKKLEKMLWAGDTTLTFTDSRITENSFIGVFADVWYLTKTVSAGSVTLTFPAQSSDIMVGIEVK